MTKLATNSRVFPVPRKRGGAKPGERRGGRRKGTPNKVTADLKEAIQNAFTKVGGEDYLVRVARKSPETFCRLLGKLLPKDVVWSGDPPHAHVGDDDLARWVAFEMTKKVVDDLRTGDKPTGTGA